MLWVTLAVMAKMIVCAECERTMPHGGFGLCSRCYKRKNPRRLVKCEDCGETKRHHSRGLCNACYSKAYRSRDVVCKDCGRTRPKATNELCTTCYYRNRPRSVNMIECSNCRETKPHAAHGLCGKCYDKLHRPKITKEAREARAERGRVKDENRARVEQELHDKRCETCERLLRITRGSVTPGAKFCDPFCRAHNPETRAKRNEIWMLEATEAELERRKIEAFTHDLEQEAEAVNAGSAAP